MRCCRRRSCGPEPALAARSPQSAAAARTRSPQSRAPGQAPVVVPMPVRQVQALTGDVARWAVPRSDLSGRWSQRSVRAAGPASPGRARAGEHHTAPTGRRVSVVSGPGAPSQPRAMSRPACGARRSAHGVRLVGGDGSRRRHEGRSLGRGPRGGGGRSRAASHRPRRCSGSRHPTAREAAQKKQAQILGIMRPGLPSGAFTLMSTTDQPVSMLLVVGPAPWGVVAGRATVEAAPRRA